MITSSNRPQNARRAQPSHSRNVARGWAGTPVALDRIGESVHDSVIAGYGTVGLDVPLGRDFSVGLSYVRTIGANFDLGDAHGQDFDSGTIALVLGWSF